MKPTFPGTLAAAVIALSAPAPLVAQQPAADAAMIDITCEEFLDLPAADQEMHATALTTARMDEAAADASAQPGDTPDEVDAAEEDAPSQSIPMPTDGMTSDILSPTVVALVTICENTVSEPATATDSDSSSGSSD